MDGLHSTRFRNRAFTSFYAEPGRTLEAMVVLFRVKKLTKVVPGALHFDWTSYSPRCPCSSGVRPWRRASMDARALARLVWHRHDGVHRGRLGSL